MLTMLMLGFPLCVLIYVVQRENLSILFRASLVLFCLCGFAAAAFLLHSGVFLDGTSWWEKTPWKHIIMFALMFAGMEGSVLNAAITNRRREKLKLKAQGKIARVRLQIDKWDFFQPALFSLITFSLLDAQVGNATLNVANVALSFQTGFLWQSVIGKQIKEQLTS